MPIPTARAARRAARVLIKYVRGFRHPAANELAATTRISVARALITDAVNLAGGHARQLPRPVRRAAGRLAHFLCCHIPALHEPTPEAQARTVRAHVRHSFRPTAGRPVHLMIPVHPYRHTRN